MPAKEDGDAQVDNSYLLLVRGVSDHVPLVEEYQGSDCTSEPEDVTLPVGQAPQSGAWTLVSDYEVEDTGARGKQ